MKGGHFKRLVAIAVLAGLAACGTFPDKPVRATTYDFGPGHTGTPVPQPAMPALILAEITASGAADGSAVLYRLGYADPHELRSYAQARWSAPPPQLIRQRLREYLAQGRPVLDLGESAALARNSGAMPRVLRVELEEFSHFFASPAASSGLLRLQVTLMENTAAGERLMAQRSIVVRRPARTPDAAGGVQALADAVDDASGQIDQWLQQAR
jgi:cholesterol transport system auxiliary component